MKLIRLVVLCMAVSMLLGCSSSPIIRLSPDIQTAHIALKNPLDVHINVIDQRGYSHIASVYENDEKVTLSSQIPLAKTVKNLVQKALVSKGLKVVSPEKKLHESKRTTQVDVTIDILEARVTQSLFKYEIGAQVQFSVHIHHNDGYWKKPYYGANHIERPLRYTNKAIKEQLDSLTSSVLTLMLNDDNLTEELEKLTL